MQFDRYNVSSLTAFFALHVKSGNICHWSLRSPITDIYFQAVRHMGLSKQCRPRLVKEQSNQTVCNSSFTVWTHYSMVKPHCACQEIRASISYVLMFLCLWALPGVLGSWGESLFNFREQGEIAIILREPRSTLLILGNWGALSKMYMAKPPAPPLPPVHINIIFLKNWSNLPYFKFVIYVFKLTYQLAFILDKMY